MPTYNYVCNKCEHTWGEFKGMNEPKATECPECSAASIERVIGESLGGFVLKGEGWYKAGGVM